MTHVSDPTELDPDQPEPDRPAARFDGEGRPEAETSADAGDGEVFAGQLPDDGFWVRVGRRIVRRPMDWIDAPWTVQRLIRTLTAALFLVVAGIITSNVVHWDLILGAGPYMGSNRRIRWGVTGTAVGTTNNNWAWIYNIEQGDTGVEARTVHPTLNTWMCVEWQWDPANQRIRFYFNDTEATALHVDTTLPNGTALQVPTFSTMSFGLAKYQTTNADLVFWIDEIALDTQRIGCAN